MVPEAATGLGDVFQLTASNYRNPEQLPDGGVLVVGAGASGCQIAEELLDAGRRVYLSVGAHRRAAALHAAQVAVDRRCLGDVSGGNKGFNRVGIVLRQANPIAGHRPAKS